MATVGFQAYHENERTLSKTLAEKLMGKGYPNARVVSLRFGGFGEWGQAVTSGDNRDFLSVEGNYTPRNIANAFFTGEGHGTLLATVEPSDAFGFPGVIHYYVNNPTLRETCEQVVEQAGLRVVSFFGHIAPEI